MLLKARAEDLVGTAPPRESASDSLDLARGASFAGCSIASWFQERNFDRRTLAASMDECSSVETLVSGILMLLISRQLSPKCMSPSESGRLSINGLNAVLSQVQLLLAQLCRPVEPRNVVAELAEELCLPFDSEPLIWPAPRWLAVAVACRCSRRMAGNA